MYRVRRQTCVFAAKQERVKRGSNKVVHNLYDHLMLKLTEDTSYKKQKTKKQKTKSLPENTSHQKIIGQESMTIRLQF